jgi:Lon protease-like protein
MSQPRRRADDGDLERALPELPLFPLPGTVFFPHTLLPLHVFEPRYRQMTEHVLGSHQHMAVVLLDDTRRGAAVAGVARVAGVGRVVHHERLADGRFHLLLQGIARAELVEELPMEGRLFRRASARLMPCEDQGDEVAREVQTLRSCYARLLEVCPDQKDVLGDLPLRVQEPRVLADVVCAAVLEDVTARQGALEETDVARRLKSANDALATLLLQGIGTETAGMH